MADNDPLKTDEPPVAIDHAGPGTGPTSSTRSVTPIVPRMQMTLAGLTINFEEAGQEHAGPTVILIHGFGATLETWTDIFPTLSQRWHTIRLDLRGSGFSSKPLDDLYSPQDQAAVVRTFILAKGLPDVVLVGHSLGGAVALLSCLRQQQEALAFRTVGLILIDSAGYPQALPFFVGAISNPVTRVLVYALPPTMRAKLTLERIFRVPTQVTADRIRRYAFFLDLPGSRHALVSTARHLTRQDATAESVQINSLTLPTLVIWGAEDPAIPVENASRFHSAIKSSIVTVLPQTGHVPHEERPAETLAAIMSFLGALA